MPYLGLAAACETVYLLHGWTQTDIESCTLSRTLCNMQFKHNITAQDFCINALKMLQVISEDICRGKLRVDSSRSERRCLMRRMEGDKWQRWCCISPAPWGFTQTRFAESYKGQTLQHQLSGGQVKVRCHSAIKNKRENVNFSATARHCHQQQAGEEHRREAAAAAPQHKLSVMFTVDLKDFPRKEYYRL